jgi:hypothetical protein
MADATVSRTEFAGDRARSVTASTRKSGTATRRRHARSASARTWCSCQVARDACTVAMTCRAMTSASIVGVGAGAWPMTRRTSSSTCSAPPRISPASALQVRRCSASERGACFASRVDSVACCASSCRPYTQADMDAGYTYQLSVLQAEISVAQMLAFHCPGWCSSSSCPRQPRQRPPGQAHLDLRAAHPHRPPPHPDAAGTG